MLMARDEEDAVEETGGEGLLELDDHEEVLLVLELVATRELDDDVGATHCD